MSADGKPLAGDLFGIGSDKSNLLAWHPSKIEALVILLVPGVVLVVSTHAEGTW